MLRFLDIEDGSRESMTDAVSTSPASPASLVAFTDGACTANGKACARGACAVVWPDHPEFDEGAPLPTDGVPHTNNRAEFSAVLLAMRRADRDLDPQHLRTLVVYTDSMLVINSLTQWMPKWKRSGWKKMTDGKPVANVDLLQELDGLMRRRRVVFRHVRAHTNKQDYDSINNAKVDALAKASVGANSPAPILTVTRTSTTTKQQYRKTKPMLSETRPTIDQYFTFT